MDFSRWHWRLGSASPHSVKALALLFCLLCAPNGFAYEVWIGLLCLPASAADHPEQWHNAAIVVQGLNANTPPLKPAPGTPCANEHACTANELRAIARRFTSVSNTIVELPRSAVALRGPLNVAIDNALKHGDQLGLKATYLMFYDNRLDKTMYSWTVPEVQQMRQYLDSTGRKEIKLVYDARNNSPSVRDWCASPIVDAVELEAAANLWFTNVGKRQELLKWLWTNPATAHKKLIFQIPPTKPDPFGSVDNFMDTRRMIVFLGELMGADFLRSDKVIFLPVTYNTPTVPFYPELTADGSHYANTMTGLALSLIEQKNLFEGRGRKPTQADADDKTRRVKSTQ